MQEDFRHRVVKAVFAVEYLLASNPPLIREAWIRIWGWYKEAPPSPTIATIERMIEERVELFQVVHLLVRPIPVGITVFSV